ncbi:uncharacterized protein LOC118433289 [Folsomia candida]|uniref:uncharacterized protein LOC118433289 n=1 Tax=Folsomia candida TaxID=158441 RepID=UPI001604FC18|nr:uncharacterized protein LOC118433289 [Folsomia candida]
MGDLRRNSGQQDVPNSKPGTISISPKTFQDIAQKWVESDELASPDQVAVFRKLVSILRDHDLQDVSEIIRGTVERRVKLNQLRSQNAVGKSSNCKEFIKSGQDAEYESLTGEEDLESCSS